MHPLVQVVIRSRLDAVGRQAWAQTAVELLESAFPVDSANPDTWRQCERLSPSVSAVAENVMQLQLASEVILPATQGLLPLLHRTNTYALRRGEHFKDAREELEAAAEAQRSALERINLATGPDWDAARDELDDACAKMQRGVALAELTEGRDNPAVIALRTTIAQNLEILTGLENLVEHEEGGSSHHHD